jgi:RNA polymerase sigma-70 factor (ECF subfamily)
MRASTRLTDIELMERVRNGDLDQLSHLFERHHRRLYSFCVRLTGRRELSEDLVQEVFLRILKYRHTFRGNGEFVIWMYSIARNTLLDRRWRQESVRTDQEAEPASTDPIALEIVEHQQTRDLLELALSRLAIEKREVLILSRYEGLRYEEIAGLLGCSVEAVKSRVYRAMDDLRHEYFKLSGESSHG